jgi:hypothetical protein
VATWVAADCGDQSCMAAASWRRTSSGTTTLVMRATCWLYPGLWWFGMESC